MVIKGIVFKGYRQDNQLPEVIVKVAESIRQENGQAFIISKQHYLPEVVNAFGVG